MIKLTDIINELGINNPISFSEEWVKKNINEIIEITESYNYINNDDPITNPIEIESDNFESYKLKDDDFKYFLLSNKLTDCECLAITNDLDPDLFEGNGPVSSGKEYELKRVKFQIQQIGC